MIAQAVKKIPFVFSVNYQFDDGEELADIVLPDNSYLERYVVMDKGSATTPEVHNQFATWYTLLRQPALVTPVVNSRDTNDILIDLAERIGILYGKNGVNDRINTGVRLKAPYTLDLNKKYGVSEVADLQLKSRFGEQYGLEWFKTNGSRVLRTAPVKQFYGILQNPDVRLPIYREYYVWARNQWSSELKKYNVNLDPSNEYVTSALHGYPVWNTNPQMEGDTKVPDEYDLVAAHSKTMVSSMANPMTQPWLIELMELWDPYTMSVWINKKTAQKKGIKDGDPVVVESLWGKTNGLAKLTDLIHPDGVGILGCFGNQSVDLPSQARLGPHINALCTLDQRYTNPITVGLDMHARVKVYKV